MNRMHDGHGMLLAAVDPASADLARQNLEEAGIPAVIEDEFGLPGWEWKNGAVNLFVPASAFERAREVLRTAGSPADLAPLVASGALGARAIEAPPTARTPAKDSSLAWLLIVLFVALVIGVLLRQSY